MIVHISGPSGSGKTTIGRRLKKHFGTKIIVKDLDDLRDAFVKSFYGDRCWTYINEIEYQKYIDKYIRKHKSKLLVFVGLNDNVLGDKKLYYKLYSDHNFYITLDDATILKQKCARFFRDIAKDVSKDKTEISKLTEKNDKFVKMLLRGIETECVLKKTKQMSRLWNRDYKKQGYEFMSADDIYKKCCTIILTFLQTHDKI